MQSHGGPSFGQIELQILNMNKRDSISGHVNKITRIKVAARDMRRIETPPARTSFHNLVHIFFVSTSEPMRVKSLPQPHRITELLDSI